MKPAAFEELLASVRQMGAIRRGTLKPARVTKFKPADVKALRSRLGQSQTEFALMIGVSVATLRNWEQGRRRPEGPSLALLRVANANPLLVAKALYAPPRRRADKVDLKTARTALAESGPRVKWEKLKKKVTHAARAGR